MNVVQHLFQHRIWRVVEEIIFSRSVLFIDKLVSVKHICLPELLAPFQEFVVFPSPEFHEIGREASARSYILAPEMIWQHRIRKHHIIVEIDKMICQIRDTSQVLLDPIRVERRQLFRVLPKLLV